MRTEGKTATAGLIPAGLSQQFIITDVDTVNDLNSTFAFNFIIMITIVIIWIINRDDNQMTNIGKYYAFGMVVHFLLTTIYIIVFHEIKKTDGIGVLGLIRKKVQ